MFSVDLIVVKPISCLFDDGDAKYKICWISNIQKPLIEYKIRVACIFVTVIRIIDEHVNQ